MSIITLISTVVLLLMATAFTTFQYYSFRESEKNKLSSLALVIASNSSAALAFDSKEDANEILDALKADKHIVVACLYNNQGEVFAVYPATLNKEELPQKPPKSGMDFKQAFLEGYQPVVQKNLHLGTLYIKSDLENIYVQMKSNTIIAFFLIAVALLITYILSKVLQKTISHPIIALERTAKIISEGKDYSVRADKNGNDELGSLTDAFNQMLSQIEIQNSEIKKANEESTKLAAIVASSADAILSCSLDLIITSCNASTERIVEFSCEELIGRPASLLIHPDHQNRIVEIISQLKSGNNIDSFETQFVTKTGKVLDVSLTISPVNSSENDLTGLSLTARDITLQKESERKIVENEEQLRLAVEAAELATYDWDLKKETLHGDKRFSELVGLQQDDYNSDKGIFFKSIHEEDRERVNQLVKSALNKSFSGGTFDVEYRIVKENKKLKWVRAKGKVFFDQDEKPVRFIGTVLDITNKKQEEIRKNDFIAIISHELKTPLTTIRSYVQLLLSKAKKEGDAFTINSLTRTESQAKKMTSMIKDFLSLARIEEGKLQLSMEAVDLAPLLEEIYHEAYLLNSQHVIELKDCVDLKVWADRDKLGQVLINLISNAIKYSPHGSTITIGCEKQGDEKVKIYVKDEGIGISQQDQEKLFNRFYRVDNERVKTVSGFGIGLYIVSEILLYHNSKIMVESMEGKGSTFYFSLNTHA